MADGNPIIDLYRSMAQSSDPEVKGFALSMGFKEFSNKITNDENFRGEIYYGLSQKGLTDLEPTRWEQSLGIYKGDGQLKYLKGDAEKRERESTIPEIAVEETQPEEEKGWMSSALQMGKDIIDSVITIGKSSAHAIGVGAKRGELVQEMSKNAAAIDQALFDEAKNPNLIDFDAVANINKEIEEYGSSDLEKKFYDPNSREGWDWAKMTIPTILGSFATLARSGYDEITAGIVGGGATGLVAGIGTGPGALATGAVGAGIGAQAGGAAAAAEMEYMLSVMDGLKEKKIDITNPNALRKAWANKNLMEEIRRDALKRTGIILAADIAGGVAGQALGGYRTGVREALKAADKGFKVTRFAKVKDKLVDIALEASTGMGGEAGAILSTKGKITEEDVPGIVMEGLGEIPAIEVISKPITAPIERLFKGKPTPTEEPAEAAPAQPQAPGVEKVSVTQEEFDDFVKNNKISEARAGAIAEDAQLAMSNPNHMENLMAEDPLYAGMVEKFIEKGIGQAEVETLTEATYEDVGRLYGMTKEELMNAINQDHPSFNQEITDVFNNTFNRLFQSYKEANDSQDKTGVSGQVGEGQESQQAQPQQGGGAQETGGGGVLQAPQGTVAQVGQVVEIDGKRYYVKDEGGGKLVVETDEGKIYEIPQDNPTVESIGATLLREAQPDKNYGIQVNNNDTATINGEKYTILRDNKGNVVGARNQRRSNVTLNKAEVLGELQRQLSDPKLRQLTTVSVQQPLTQINESVQPEGAATAAEPTQPQPVSPEMAGATVAQGTEAAPAVQPGGEGGAQTMAPPVSGVTEAQPGATPAPVAEGATAPISETAPAPVAPEALPSFEEYDKNFKGEGMKKGQRMQNKEEFSNKYGAEVYEGMRKINDNFTRITDALIKEGRLNKKC